MSKQIVNLDTALYTVRVADRQSDNDLLENLVWYQICANRVADSRKTDDKDKNSAKKLHRRLNRLWKERKIWQS